MKTPVISGALKLGDGLIRVLGDDTGVGWFIRWCCEGWQNETVRVFNRDARNYTLEMIADEIEGSFSEGCRTVIWRDRIGLIDIDWVVLLNRLKTFLTLQTFRGFNEPLRVILTAPVAKRGIDRWGGDFRILDAGDDRWSVVDVTGGATSATSTSDQLPPGVYPPVHLMTLRGSDTEWIDQLLDL